MPDAPGSVRGLAGGTSGLAGSADYDVFGAIRASSGASSTFGFAGEQTDPETGFSFLRARYYSPVIGRFLSTDSAMPNAPGTQGYNLYAYAANDPATWVDPSGHNAWVAALPRLVPDLLEACATQSWCSFLFNIGKQVIQFASETDGGELLIVAGVDTAAFALLACAMDTGSGIITGEGILYHLVGDRFGCYYALAAIHDWFTHLGSDGPPAPAPGSPPVPNTSQDPGGKKCPNPNGKKAGKHTKIRSSGSSTF